MSFCVEKQGIIIYNVYGVRKMSKRFIVDEENISFEEQRVIVKGEEVHHINVLRYKVGETVYINQYELRIEKLGKDILQGIVIGTLPQKGVPKTNITLIQSYLKSDKMDYVVQKAVELGVKNIIPVITKNTVVKLDEKDKIKKVERLSKIAKEAVEQCGRADTVDIRSVENISKISFGNYDAVIVCHEASKTSLKDTLNNMKSKKKLAVIIGPEGGLEQAEVDTILKNNNAVDVSLGERILRAETASLAILSILGYELG